MLNQDSETSNKNVSTTKKSDSELTKRPYSLVKGPKPLQKLRFYLDIKSHAVTTKLEAKIRELGGAVEFFLDREVTHVISDRPQCNVSATGVVLSSPSTPQTRSVDVNSSNESPISTPRTSTAGKLRQKTRADAMLEKVRLQSTTKVRDPLENAKLWDIPIWSINKVFSWLEKVSASITLNTTQKNKKSVKVISIKSPFIKFEPFARNARPVYKTLDSWPVLDLGSNPGKPAFVLKSNSPQPNQKTNQTDSKISAKAELIPTGTNDCIMTRKQRTRLSVRAGGNEQEVDKQLIVGGFCEICHCEYREIGEHVRSEQHLNFVKNDANFLELDSLISAGANVEAFLRLNGNTAKDLSNCPLFGRRSLRKLHDKTSPEKCNENLDEYSPPVTRNKMPRTRSSSNHVALSPTGSETVHHLRSRSQLWLLGSPGDEESGFQNKVKESPRSEKKNYRLGDEEGKGTKENDGKNCEVGRPKKTCPKTKRVSADERLVADNKTYYKVEVMTTKLRSSGLGAREHEVARRAATPIPEEPDSDEQSLVVKFKRVRRSELSVLNDEAENFMFPRKEDPSLSDMETDEAPNTTRSTIKTESSDIESSEVDPLTIKQEQLNEQAEESMNNIENEHFTRRKRKRNDIKSDMEESNDAMSLDNCEGETNLRKKRRKGYAESEETADESSQDESVSSDLENRKKKKKGPEDASTVRDESPQVSLVQEPTIKVEIPDNIVEGCGEINEKEPMDEVKPKVLKDELKFSFELLPKSEPWYQTFRRQDMGEEYYTCVSDPGYAPRFYLPYQLPFLIPLSPRVCIEEYHRKKRAYLNLHAAANGGSTTDGSMASTATATESLGEAGQSGEPTVRVIKRRRRRHRFSNHPRKSPRQHASTLAILSSLIQQRKKRERKSHGESDTSLPAIPEETKTPEQLEAEARLEEENRAELERVVDEILSAPMDELSELELQEDEGIIIKDKPDAIELLQNFNQCDDGWTDLKTPLGSESVRVIRRKRKKNRTGWPKKKRLFTRKVEPKSEDVSLPELDDSRLTEASNDCETQIGDLTSEDATTVTIKQELIRTNVQHLSDTKTEQNSSATLELDVIQGVSLTEQSILKTELMNQSVTNNSELDNENFNNNSVCELKIEEHNLLDIKTENSVSISELAVQNNLLGVANTTEEIPNKNVTNTRKSDILCRISSPECKKQDNDVTSGKVYSDIKKNTQYGVTILDCKKPDVAIQDLKKQDVPCKKNQRNSSSDCSGPEEVIASQTDRIGNCVNVTLDKWENAEKVLHAKMNDNETKSNEKLLQYQPFVRVQKIDNTPVALQNANRRLRSSSSPERKPKAKRARIVPPTSPRSPRKLRAPRGKWYRER